MKKPLWQVGDYINIVSGNGMLLTPTPVRIEKLEDRAAHEIQYYRVEGTTTSYPHDQIEPGSMCTHALRYTVDGWHIFPLAEGTKVPVKGFTDWENRASTDPDVIRAWWGEMPHANIACATGPSNLLVADLDIKHGNDGPDTWHNLKAEHVFSDDKTPCSLTANGGQHVIYDQGTAQLGNSSGKLGPGIDTRGVGGYIVLPPSVLANGKEYAWEVSAHPFDVSPRPVPQGLVDLLTAANGDKQTEVIDGDIDGGERNATLTSLAGSMRHRGMVKDEILAALIVVNKRRCKPPLGHAEVRRIATSVMRYEPTIPMDLGIEEPTGKTGKTGWDWLTLEDAYKDKPPREFLIEKLLPIPSLSMPFGPPGVMKSMLMQDAALNAAIGGTWLPGLPGENIPGFQCMEAVSLWIDVDNGQDRLERRFKAIGMGLGVAATAPLYYMSFPIPPFLAGQPPSTKLILAAIEELGAQFVVFDNLGTISGGVDENSSEMVKVMSELRRIAEFGHCAVSVIHHSNKGQAMGRLGDKLRGHSSIEGALDLALMVSREGQDDIITLKSTKTRDVPVASFSAMFTYTQDADGELVTARFYGAGAPEGGAMTKQEQAELCIMKDLQDGMSQSEIVSMVKANAGVGRNSTLVAIKRLVNQGKLDESMQGRRGAVCYVRGLV